MKYAIKFASLLLFVVFHSFAQTTENDPVVKLLKDMYFITWNKNTPEQQMKEDVKVFAEKGCVCVSCGAKGTILARGIDKAKSKHWDVYTEDFLPLTVDHIFPKSKGGTNDLENLQPMCYTCNQIKADKINELN